MRFASIVFRVAAVWGVLVLVPLFFVFNGSGIAGNPPFTYLQAYFGFLCVARSPGSWRSGSSGRTRCGSAR